MFFCVNKNTQQKKRGIKKARAINTFYVIKKSQVCNLQKLIFTGDRLDFFFNKNIIQMSFN